MGPTTPIRDIGAGADADPIGGIWTHFPFYGGSSGANLKRIGNKLASSSASRRGCYLAGSTFGPETEVHSPIDIEPANNTETVDWWIAIHNPTGTVTGYFVRYIKNFTAGVDTIQLIRRDSGANVVIDTVVQNNVPPNSRYVGRRSGTSPNQHIVVEKYDGVAETWSTLSDVIDNTYTGAAYIGHGIEGTATRTREFGGGTVGVGMAPVNVVAPVISGAAETWQTLTVDTGAWNGSPDSYAYQWKRGGVAISGATTNSYELDVIDEGTTINCTVTASNATGSASVTTAGVTAAPFSGGTFQIMQADVSGEWTARQMMRIEDDEWVVV